MSRKHFFIVLGLCLAVTWAINGFAKQHQRSNEAQTSPDLIATVDFEENGQVYNLLTDGIAKLKNGKLLIEYNILIDNYANDITKKTEIIFKVQPSDEMLFNQIVVTMPFLEGYAKERLIYEFEAAMNDSEIFNKPNGKISITDREGNLTSTWNILGWHIESFNFPTLDSKDDSQLIQYVTIRVEKLERDDDDDDNDNEQPQLSR